MKLPSSSSLPSSATSPPVSSKSYYQSCELAATRFPITAPNTCSFTPSTSAPVLLLHATNNPRGFGKPLKKPKKGKKTTLTYNDDKDNNNNDDDVEEARRDTGVIPEVVTNRMISRMGFSVGIPLFIGLMFFPFFYYLKVVQKIDVPNWVPFIVSFVFFGTALLGVSYGIVSSSWDPLREGSLLGWNEAQRNWPVFWGSIWGGGRSDKKF
ncbi:Protein PAM68, chloroplastic [Linum grandiflorum]